MRNYFVGIIALTLFSCRCSTDEKPVAATPGTDTFWTMPASKDSLQESTDNTVADEPIHVTTQLPYDSLSRYFVIRDISHLDRIDTLLAITSFNRYKRIVFDRQKPDVRVKDSTPVFNSGEYYIIGNYPLSNQNRKALVLLYYTESWGSALELLTFTAVDHQIIALETITGTGGDGGDYYTQSLRYLKKDSYRYESEESFLLENARPAMRYKLKENGILNILENGNIRKERKTCDSTVVPFDN